MSDKATMDLSVAVCQLTSIDDLQKNTEQILGLLGQLELSPPDLVCFPENSLYMRVREGTKAPPVALDSDAVKKISTWAVQHKSFVHLGSVPILRDGKMQSSSLLLAPDGRVRDNYQKIHLFDVDVEGHKPVRESDIFTHGSEPSIFTVNGWKIGSSICYDLRFAELYARYAREEVDAIVVPSAFLVPTGRDHWEILLRARAIESQAYVLAAAQGGIHHGVAGGERATYGHSMIIDPWGKILLEEGDIGGHRILRTTLSRERIQRVRAQIPMKGHRRLGRL